MSKAKSDHNQYGEGPPHSTPLLLTVLLFSALLPQRGLGSLPIFSPCLLPVPEGSTV